MIETTAEHSSFRVKTDKWQIIQRLIAPDPAINSEQELFYHNTGLAGYDETTGSFYALNGAELRFDSYFNVFPANVFDLQETNTLALHIQAQGKCVLEIIMVRQDKSWLHLFRGILDADGAPQIITMPQVPLEGLIYARFVAVEDTTIQSMDWVVEGPVRNAAKVTGVITTFRRDKAVQKTSARLQAYFETNRDLADDFNLLVIDNGGETDSIDFAKGQVVKNKNYGGAGGFTRGLLESVKTGTATHVLFMDDDAVFFPEALRRTISILRYAADPALAISGSMITESHKWRLWEASATFNTRCKPIHHKRDLRRFEEVIHISRMDTVSNRYGGWWYFCFPIHAMKTWPFPFFVRGDDVCFSLANEFKILNVPGIVSHQEDFSEKQSPMTVYLDMRYHLVAHLMFERLALSKKQIKTMMAGYFDRLNDAYHYESAEALLLAMEDVLRGGKFWEENLDMSQRRAEISGFTQNEKLVTPLEFSSNEVARHSSRRHRGKWWAFLRKLSYNGHRLPDRFFYSKPVLFPLDVRANVVDSFRRRSTITFDPNSRTGYICHIDKRRYFVNRGRFKAVMNELLRNYEQLQQEYRQNGQSMTTMEAWESRLAGG